MSLATGILIKKPQMQPRRKAGNLLVFFFGGAGSRFVHLEQEILSKIAKLELPNAEGRCQQRRG